MSELYNYLMLFCCDGYPCHVYSMFFFDKQVPEGDLDSPYRSIFHENTITLQRTGAYFHHIKYLNTHIVFYFRMRSVQEERETRNGHESYSLSAVALRKAYRMEVSFKTIKVFFYYSLTKFYDIDRLNN